MKRIISSFILITSILSLHTAYATDKPQMEINKQIVIEFYDQLINQKNFEKASLYLDSQFIQHNPVVVDGVKGVREFIQFLQTNYPNAHSDIKKIFADDDYVLAIH